MAEPEANGSIVQAGAPGGAAWAPLLDAMGPALLADGSRPGNPILKANPASLSLTGFAPHEITGRPLATLATGTLPPPGPDGTREF
ncbi:hypothetical protein ACLBXP_25685, partial [Methylobacterium sp. A54F]